MRILLDLAQLIESLRPADARKARRELDHTAQQLILPQRRDPVEESVARRFCKQLDHLFTFLGHPNVDATNNLAECQLRPAVIARKLSCGNRTVHGAHT